MPKLSEMATINGKPVYKDRNGDLCTETNGFQHLRALTPEEELKLLKGSRQLETPVGIMNSTTPLLSHNL